MNYQLYKGAHTTWCGIFPNSLKYWIIFILIKIMKDVIIDGSYAFKV